jgi:hypothetical protein
VRRELTACALCWLAALGCHDDGVVGGVAECAPACEADEECDALRGVCVDCDEGMCELADECDDCAASDALCIAMLCQSCTTSAECRGEENTCQDGLCVEPDEDADFDS